MACVVWLSPLEANQYSWVTASTSIVKLEVETIYLYGLHSVYGWWSHLAWQLSPILTGLWWLNHQCTLWDLVVCCLLSRLGSLTPFCLLAILNGAYPSFLARVSHIHSHKDAGSIWIPFSLIGLFELRQLAYLQYWVLCLTCPKLAMPQSASICIFHSFMEWAVGISTDWSILWPAPLSVWFALVGGMAWNMVSVGVSFVVSSMTCVASFCTLSSFSRFVCVIVVRPSQWHWATTLGYGRKRRRFFLNTLGIAFRTEKPFLCFSAVVSTCL